MMNSSPNFSENPAKIIELCSFSGAKSELFLLKSKIRRFTPRTRGENSSGNKINTNKNMLLSDTIVFNLSLGVCSNKVLILHLGKTSFFWTCKVITIDTMTLVLELHLNNSYLPCTTDRPGDMIHPEVTQCTTKYIQNSNLFKDIQPWLTVILLRLLTQIAGAIRPY